MTKQLLDAPEIGPALQQMSGRRMTETVWSHVGDPGFAQPGVDDPPHRALVDPPAFHPEEQRRPGARADENGPTANTPGIHRIQRRQPQRHDPLAATLPQHPDGPPLPVDVVEIEAAELTDPDTRGVENLQQRLITQLSRHRVRLVMGRTLSAPS